MLTLPALDLSRDITFPDLQGPSRTTLFSNGRRLLISTRQVVIIEGAVVSRKLIYDEDVVGATFTRFKGNNEDEDEALAVCLQKSAYIYYPHGRTYIVSFPFTLKNAFPFELGLMLEREQDKSSPSSHRFLTLVDPIGDFRIVTTSSTSVVSPQESLMAFPARGLNKGSLLCVTFNSRLCTVGIYHIKASSRNNILSGSNSLKKRKHPSISTPNPSKILEDDLLHDFGHPFVSLSVNLDKKRTSTLMSGISSIARMGSESFPEAGKSSATLSTLELGTLKKDMILTKIDTLSLKARRNHVSINGLHYEDKEAVAISNRATRETHVYIYSKQSSPVSRYETSYVLQCTHAVPLNHQNFPGWLVILKDGTLQMVHPFLDISAPAIDLANRFPPISSISSTFENRVALIASKTHDTHILELILEPLSLLVTTCLKTWNYLSGSKINEHVWVLWRSALMLDQMKDEWNAFVITLLSLIYPFDDSEEETAMNEISELLPKAKVLHEHFDIDYSFQDLLPYIVVSLHLIYEETNLDILSKHNLNKLGTLLTQLTVWMGWLDLWTSYYMIDHKGIDLSVKLLLVVLVYAPPNYFDSLMGLIEGKGTKFLKFSQLVEESDSVNMLITPRTHMIYNLFQLLVSPNSDPSDIVNSMCEYGINSDTLETFPIGISVPLKECLLLCQENPAFEWNSKVLELVGRKDLTMLLEPHQFSVATTSQLLAVPADESGRDANAVLANIFSKNDNVIAWDGQSEADRIHITKLIFDQDRRYFEITTLLHQTRTQTATLVVDESISEYDSTVLKRELAALVALRTLTIPLGRAALFYAGRMPLLTEKFPIPKFNLNTLIAPAMTTIVLNEGSISQKVVDWGHFHNGVSSGLSVSRESKGITGSWVIFNKPLENNAQHAGFLLGLGLNGHLKKLEEWHIYNYLGPKHPLTSVGLLIGMAASIKGSMDNKLTKVLSVHAVALLPQGANDLNVPVIVQTAGLIGIGLLYLETQHRRMSEILLSQIGGYTSQIENDEEHEGYRLAAGVALGFINLGKGDDLRGLNDTHVVDRLLALAVSMKDSHPVSELDKSGSGAILALGFIYLRTRNSVLASKLQIPQTEQLLDYVRPDLLLLRCLVKNLIMWDLIDPTTLWVESEIPDVLRKKYNVNSIQSLDSDQVGTFNILGGACLSLAVKYASSQDLNARTTLLHYLDIFMLISTTPTTNYDQKIAFNSASQIQNLLALCVSVVMAGSGDLEVFRRLRVLHGRVSKNVHYGNHMAVNMALGFLFLGGGQYSFGDSNFAIAILVTSLYPVFPSENNEHEVHLQVMRHFWALAVEPKCLVIRDVKDRSPIKVPVKITLSDGRVEKMDTPCLLPQMKEISSIEVRSSEFFNVKIDFLVNSEYLELFKRSLTIYVFKKRNYELLKTSVSALLENESKHLQVENGELSVNTDVQKLLLSALMDPLSSFEKQMYLHESSDREKNYDSEAISSGLSVLNIIDSKIELNRMATKPESVQDLQNLKLLFAYADHLLNDDLHFVGLGYVEQLKQSLWQLASSS